MTCVAGCFVSFLNIISLQLFHVYALSYEDPLDLSFFFFKKKNIAELAVGNIVRRVLHIIREEDLSLATAAVAGLNLSAVSDDEDDNERGDHPVLSAAAVAAAARSTLRPPSLQTLLEDMPDSAAVPQSSSSGGDSEGKSKCELSVLSFRNLFNLILPTILEVD